MLETSMRNRLFPPAVGAGVDHQTIAILTSYSLSGIGPVRGCRIVIEGVADA
jgi:hypothetical protein